MSRYIIHDIETSSDSDRENFDGENSNEENSSKKNLRILIWQS